MNGDPSETTPFKRAKKKVQRNETAQNKKKRKEGEQHEKVYGKLPRNFDHSM